MKYLKEELLKAVQDFGKLIPELIMEGKKELDIYAKNREIDESDFSEVLYDSLSNSKRRKTMRKFEVISSYKDEEINLPKRGTKLSAGYDIESAETIVIPSLWSSYGVTGTLVKTGLKVYLNDDEFLDMRNRSGSFNKTGLMLANNAPVVDADYVDNEKNEGHIYLNFINFGTEDVAIQKGDRIAQAVFQKYLITEDDSAEGIRAGGFGSTGIK